MAGHDYDGSAARKLDIFSSAVTVLASALGSASRPIAAGLSAAAPSSAPRTATLYGPSGQVLPDSQYVYRRSAAKRTGSMKNWIPQRLFGNQAEAMERERIVERSIDLANNDPNAAGVVDSFAATIVGSGLTPIPLLDQDTLQIDKDAMRTLQGQQRMVYRTWYPWADAAERMTFGGIQYLAQRNIVEYGEYLILCHMIDDPVRPYSLACNLINPLRLRTPVDRSSDPNIKDGVELGEYGQPVAYWIKKSSITGLTATLSDISANFLRIPARTGHRWNVLHGFVSMEPEQVRGMPYFAPAMKFFRDLNDFLDAELVSNVVTAAFSLFIETGAAADPWNIASSVSTITETGYKSDGSSQDIRYQELVPGAIMYGSTGQKPHPIAAARPGATFEPFTKVIKKAIAMGLGIPYPVLFKDVESVNFAGFRSAMLDAWRVFMARRTWLGDNLNQRVYTMLMEEAYLRGHITASNFYINIHAITHAEWRGSPKGDIEPVKAVQADVMAIQNNIKTRAEAIAERGGDLRTTFDQLQEEQEMMEDRGLTESPVAPIQPGNAPDGGLDGSGGPAPGDAQGDPPDSDDPDNPDGGQDDDGDMEGAGTQ
jgi:lambda family phage portal protein